MEAGTCRRENQVFRAYIAYTEHTAAVPSPSRNNPVRLKAPFNEKEPRATFPTPLTPFLLLPSARASTNYHGNPFN